MMTPALALFALWLLAGVVPVHVLRSEGGGVWPLLCWAWRDGSRVAVALAALVGAPALAVYQIVKVCTWRILK